MLTKKTNALMQLFTLIDKIEGKIKLQKVIFLLQERRVIDFDLEYKYALYGPYSETLQIEIEYLSRIGFLNQTLENDVLKYELNKDSAIKIEADKDFIRNKAFIDSLIDKESELLEVTSTIYYLKARHYNESDIQEKIKVLKPKLQDKIPRAFEFYNSLEHVN